MYEDKIIQLTTHKENLIALSQDGKIYAWNDKWIEMPLPVKKKWRGKNCEYCKSPGKHKDYCQTLTK